MRTLKHGATMAMLVLSLILLVQCVPVAYAASEPLAAMLRNCAAMVDADYQRVRSDLSKELTSELTELIDGLRQLDRRYGHVQSCELTTERDAYWPTPDGRTDDAILDVKRTRTECYRVIVHFVLEEGVWKIADGATALLSPADSVSAC